MPFYNSPWSQYSFLDGFAHGIVGIAFWPVVAAHTRWASGLRYAAWHLPALAGPLAICCGCIVAVPGRVMWCAPNCHPHQREQICRKFTCCYRCVLPCRKIIVPTMQSGSGSPHDFCRGSIMVVMRIEMRLKITVLTLMILGFGSAAQAQSSRYDDLSKIPLTEGYLSKAVTTTLKDELLVPARRSVAYLWRSACIQYSSAMKEGSEKLFGKGYNVLPDLEGPPKCETLRSPRRIPM